LGTSNAQSSTKSNDNSKPKPEISVGLWIDQIGNIDYSNNTYEVIFYFWINSTDSIYDIKNGLMKSKKITTCTQPIWESIKFACENLKKI
jgi:hypothetical protein